MTGKKHHILPRFLQKGFAWKSNEENNKFLAWEYRKNGKINIAKPIDDIGREKYFYGKAGEANADPQITNKERNKFAPLVTELRNNKISEQVEEINDDRIPELIAHFCIRNKHIRDSFRKSSEYIFKELNTYLTKKGKSFELIKSYYNNNENIFKLVNNDDITPEERNINLAIINSVLYDSKKNKQIENIREEFERKIVFSIKQILKQYEENIFTMVKEAHNTNLSKEPVPQVRTEKYRSLRWYIFYSKSPFILGDVICLFELKDNTYNFIDDNKEIKNIFLPISTNKILIGTTKKSKPKINLKKLKQIYVKHCQDYFISEISNKEMDALCPYIGESSDIISKNELDKILEEVITQYIN